MQQLSLILFSFIFFSLACSPKTAQQVSGTETPTTPKVEEPSKPPTIKSPEVPAIEEEKVTLVASIKKTACYGTCPTFETKIYSDGSVTYYGKKNVERVGHYEANLNKDAQALIRDKAIAIKYFNLSPAYPTNGRKIVDLPNTITYYQLNGKEHKIENNHEAPKALQEFEEFLIQMTEGLNWRKVGG